LLPVAGVIEGLRPHKEPLLVAAVIEFVIAVLVVILVARGTVAD